MHTITTNDQNPLKVHDLAPRHERFGHTLMEKKHLIGTVYLTECFKIFNRLLTFVIWDVSFKFTITIQPKTLEILAKPGMLILLRLHSAQPPTPDPLHARSLPSWEAFKPAIPFPMQPLPRKRNLEDKSSKISFSYSIWLFTDPLQQEYGLVLAPETTVTTFRDLIIPKHLLE